MPDSESNQDSPDKDSLSRDTENPDALPDTGAADGREPSSVAGADSELKTFGRYEIKDRLGQGGFGTVYRALDTVTGCSVALKIAHASPSEATRARFEQEIRIAATVKHPNMCQVYDVDEINGRPVIAMEYVDGETLSEYTETKDTVGDCLSAWLTMRMAFVLWKLHQKGVFHRDIKPGSIMLYRPHPGSNRIEPKVMDFGLARAVEADATELPAKEGAIAFMSPEQLTAQLPDQSASTAASSDVYSLGAVLYYLMTGQSPLELHKDSLFKMRLSHVANNASAGRNARRRDIDPSLKQIVIKASAIKPEDRYVTMADLAASLKEWLNANAPDEGPPLLQPEICDGRGTELTDDQVMRLVHAVSEHQTPGIDIIEIRRQTLEELDRAILCSLTLTENPTRVEESTNPLIWCRQHPGQSVDVQLTIADPAERGATSTISGTLVMQPSATTTDLSAASAQPLSAPAGHRSTGSKLTTLVLRGDSGDDDFDDEPDDAPELSLDPIEDDFELPEESEFELSLTALPAHVRLTTGTVHTLPNPPDVVATATGEWPYLAKLLPHRPEKTARESRSQPKQLRLDSDSTKPRPFVTACTSDGSVTASLFDNAALQVHVADDTAAAEVPLIVELTAVCRDGTSIRRYVLEPESVGSPGGDSVRRCKVRTPADAVDARVTLTIRPLKTTDTCLLTQAQRNHWLISPPLCNLTVRGLTDEKYSLSTFDFELDDVQQNGDSALLFRLLERNGGVE